MPRRKPAPQVALLLESLERGFSERAWHGHNLRRALRGVTPAQAAWRPAAARHCIAEQVLHAIWWKDFAAARISGAAQATRLLGKNWIGLPDHWSRSAWRDVRALAVAVHAGLREVVEHLRDRDLARDIGRNVTIRKLLIGVAAHDAYHTRQIELLKRLFIDSQHATRGRATVRRKR